MKNRRPYGIFGQLTTKPSKRIAYLAVCAMSLMWLVIGGPWAWRDAHNVWMFAFISLMHGMALVALTGISFMSGLNAGIHTVEYWQERALLAEKTEETKND